MTQGTYRLFIIITTLSIICLGSLQVVWVMSSLQQEKENYRTLTNIATSQVEDQIYNYFSTDYVIQNDASKAPTRSADKESEQTTRPMAASKFLGYYKSGNDSIPLYGAEVVNDSISETVVDSLIKMAVARFELIPEYTFSLSDEIKDSLRVQQFPQPLAQTENLEENELIIRNTRVPKNLSGNSWQNLAITYNTSTGKILARMKWLLIPNLVLFMLITGSFIFAFRIILRQKKIQEVRKDFISNMSHEFRTPVASVGLALEGLQKYGLSTDANKKDEYFSMATREINRLALMIERTLNIAAYEKGKIEVRQENFDLHNIINKVAASFEVHVAHRDGKIRCDLKAKQSHVIGDPDHLTQMIYNLVDNANKYSIEAPSISLSTQNPESEIIQLNITDRGIGIPENRINSIFLPFTRIKESRQHQVRGFGLGLAYVKQIVDLHQGTITLHSKKGEGTVIVIKLPLS